MNSALIYLLVLGVSAIIAYRIGHRQSLLTFTFLFLFQVFFFAITNIGVNQPSMFASLPQIAVSFIIAIIILFIGNDKKKNGALVYIVSQVLVVMLMAPPLPPLT